MAIILWALYGVLLLDEYCCSALSIQQCSPGPKYVYEHTPVQLTCGQCKDKIEWYVRGDKDHREKYVGECTKHTCNVGDKTAFRLHANMRNEPYSSVLDIINISQPDPLHVWCKCYSFYTKYLSRKYDLEESPWCKIITVPKSIVPEGFSVQLSGWKVSGTCTVQWQDGQTIPMCNWSWKYKSDSRDLPYLQGKTTSVKQGSVWYKRRNCTFEVDMPVDDGDYTYSVTVPTHPADHFSKTLRIEQPEVPKHNCPEMVLEGSSINCTCYTSKIGNPPAHIAWSESNNEQLVADNVGRENSGTFNVCHLSWGPISKETVYTVRVMHGPSEIDIRSYTITSGNNTEIVLVCTAIDVYPSAVFVWNITCDNTTDSMNTSTCTFSTAPEEAEMIIECTANNRVFENVSLSAIKVVHISGVKQSYYTNINIWIAAAVVIISMVGALIIIYVIKQQLVVCNCTTQSPVVRYAAPSGDLYTIAGTMIDDHGENQNVTFDKTVYRTQNISNHQAEAATHQTNEARKTLKPILKPKPTRTGANHTNVTGLSANRGLGVYHNVTMATMSGYTEYDTTETTQAVLPNDEYNDLHFQVHSSGNEHNDTDYNHLNPK